MCNCTNVGLRVLFCESVSMLEVHDCMFVGQREYSVAVWRAGRVSVAVS